jgi:hypothetical protein
VVAQVLLILEEVEVVGALSVMKVHVCINVQVDLVDQE